MGSFKDIWPSIEAIEKLYKFFFLFAKLLLGKNTRNELCVLIVDIIKDETLMEDDKEATLTVISSVY